MDVNIKTIRIEEDYIEIADEKNNRIESVFYAYIKLRVNLLTFSRIEAHRHYY